MYGWPGFRMKDPPQSETIKKAAEDFNKAGKILKENHDLMFCYHNHGYEFVPYEKGTFSIISQRTQILNLSILNWILCGLISGHMIQLS